MCSSESLYLKLPSLQILFLFLLLIDSVISNNLIKPMMNPLLLEVVSVGIVYKILLNVLLSTVIQPPDLILTRFKIQNQHFVDFIIASSKYICFLNIIVFVSFFLPLDHATGMADNISRHITVIGPANIKLTECVYKPLTRKPLPWSTFYERVSC